MEDVVVSPLKEESEDLKIPVNIRLASAPSRRLRAGIGYGTDTGARFSASYRDLNIFDRGHELEMELNLSQRLQGFASGYIFPGSSIDSFTGLQFNLKREDVTTYETRLISLEANRTRSLGRGRLASAYVKLQQEDSTIGAGGASSRLVLPGLRLSERRYDDVIPSLIRQLTYT